jgi:hypothetical protein
VELSGGVVAFRLWPGLFWNVSPINRCSISKEWVVDPGLTSTTELIVLESGVLILKLLS